MKLTRIEGPPIFLVCTGCKREGIGGTEDYASAASGETREPEAWYLPLEMSIIGAEGPAVYCSECSAKLVEEDPTRSVNQFYSDTAGTQIEPEILGD
jgi:hypothetical protein